MAQFSNIYDIDLQERVKYPRVLLQPIGEGDANGSRVGARVTNGGEYVALGGQCVGEVIRPDGSTVPLNGVIAGNEAYVVLDQECCSIVGHIQVSVMWVSGKNVTTLLIAYGTVVNTQTGYIVQPSEPILDLPQLLAQMQRLEEANERADEIDATIQAIRTDTAPYVLRTDAGLSWHTGGYAIVREESAGTPGDMVLTSNPSYAATDYIHVPAVASSTVYIAVAMANKYNAISFYDVNKSYLGGSRNNTGARISAPIPDDAVYFRLSTDTSVLPLADAFVEFSCVIYDAYLKEDNQRTLFDQVNNIVALKTDTKADTTAVAALISESVEDLDRVQTDRLAHTIAVSEPRVEPVYVAGSISSTSGNPMTASGNRVRTDYLGNLRYIHNPAGLLVALYYYAPDGTYIDWSGWDNYDEHRFPDPTIAAGASQMRIVCAPRAGESTITINDARTLEIYADPLGYASSVGVNGNYEFEWKTAYANVHFVSNFVDLTKYDGFTLAASQAGRYRIDYWDDDFTWLARPQEWKALTPGYYQFLPGYRYATLGFYLSGALEADVRAAITFVPSAPRLSVADATLRYGYDGESLRNTFWYTLLNMPSFGYNQDGAIYNGELFRFSSKGDVKVFDLSTGAEKYSAVIAEDIPHGNCVFFGEKYDDADPYPVIYANWYNNTPVVRGLLYGYRIGITDGAMTLTRVQTIQVGFTDSEIWTTGGDNRPYGNFLYDGANLWAYTTLDGNVNVTRFFKFAMPVPTKANITFAETDIMDRFDTDKQNYPQGCCCYRGRAYCSYLWTGDMNVVDLNAKRTIAHVDFATTPGLAGEPEFVDFYNGHLYYGPDGAFGVVEF